MLEGGGAKTWCEKYNTTFGEQRKQLVKVTTETPQSVTCGPETVDEAEPFRGSFVDVTLRIGTL